MPPPRPTQPQPLRLSLNFNPCAELRSRNLRQIDRRVTPARGRAPMRVLLLLVGRLSPPPSPSLSVNVLCRKWRRKEGGGAVAVGAPDSGFSSFLPSYLAESPCPSCTRRASGSDRSCCACGCGGDSCKFCLFAICARARVEISVASSGDWRSGAAERKRGRTRGAAVGPIA